MNLEDWAAATPDERHEQAKEWCSSDAGLATYMDLAWEAAQLLHPKIKHLKEFAGFYIGGTGNYFGEEDCARKAELGILVYMMLPAGSPHKEVPKTYLGFEVIQACLKDQRDAFETTWHQIPHELKGWSDADVEEWVDQMMEQLDGPLSSVIYHYGPVKPAIAALFRDELDRANRNPRLTFDLTKAILLDDSGKGHPYPDRNQGYDWEAARIRVHAVLKSHGVAD